MNIIHLLRHKIINTVSHICAGCTYEEGLRDGMTGNASKTDLSHLPYSQAGTVRHEDAKGAYDEGYDEGRKRSL